MVGFRVRHSARSRHLDDDQHGSRERPYGSCEPAVLDELRGGGRRGTSDYGTYADFPEPADKAAGRNAGQFRLCAGVRRDSGVFCRLFHRFLQYGTARQNRRISDDLNSQRTCVRVDKCASGLFVCHAAFDGRLWSGARDGACAGGFHACLYDLFPLLRETPAACSVPAGPACISVCCKTWKRGSADGALRRNRRFSV